jgi:hypothetical protein
VLLWNVRLRMAPPSTMRPIRKPTIRLRVDEP